MSDLFDPLAAPFHLPGDNGEAVVLIHGFTGTPAHFRLLAPRLQERGYTVLAPLLAGHGTVREALADTRGRHWVESAASAIARVADHHKLHLAGLSMGGLIALVLAGPTGATTVTTINSPIRFRDRTIWLSPLAHRLRPMVEWKEGDPPPLDPEAEPLWLTYQGFPTKAAAELLLLSRRALRAAGRLRRPSLVIQSRTDETVDPASALILRQALGRDCRLVWLEDSLHNALLDRNRHQVEEALVERFTG